MRYIIIEDEPLAAARVREFADKLTYLTFCGVFENAFSAMAYLKNNAVSLIFLDINIGQVSGIQFLEMAKPDCEVIILTAYQEYALKGFEMQVADYLLKPFTFERFCQATERVRGLQEKPELEKAFIFVKTQYRLEKVMLSELLYVEGARDYRRLHIGKQELMTLETFGELQEKLPGSRFIRVHKSYLVALDKIHSLERDFIRINNEMIPVSATYRKVLLEKIK
ncbi:two component transcriptional regulator, LytTR family [Mucilaginibacter pineti]|uniref:Two component transcriptional regulator, LytTR family n=1 Tax=Mucilaginibacter pineti TaxID=1391627 RepID=A0A1G7EKU3_9SPHI|nr:LytTR family DNA-binding domain-containing protein [Mucilaginibacter pineti]SDE64330.1 two component transcriptional regulator, LytTR family [Mucilaginibacter pineti]